MLSLTTPYSMAFTVELGLIKVTVISCMAHNNPDPCYILRTAFKGCLNKTPRDLTIDQVQRPTQLYIPFSFAEGLVCLHSTYRVCVIRIME